VLGEELFQIRRFTAKILHLARRRLPCRFAGEATHGSFE